MTEQIQDLIDKIKQEGVEAAEEQAREIEQQARQAAEDIVRQAKEQAARMVEAAESECRRKREASRQALQHAARDTMLSLRKEIEQLLMRIVSREVETALTPETLVGILSETIKGYVGDSRATEGVQVQLKESDRQAITQGFLQTLQKDLRQEITLKSADDMKAGFKISFDQGKSCFDFSESGLVEYLSHYLNPALTEIMQGKKT